MPLKRRVFIDIAKIVLFCSAFAAFQYLMEDPSYIRNFILLLVICFTAYVITHVVMKLRKRRECP